MFSTLSMLDKLSTGGEAENLVEPEEAKVEVQYVWTFAKFVERSRLMQDVLAEKTRTGDSFNISEVSFDPWMEYGQGEICRLQREVADRTEDSVNASRASVSAPADVQALQRENQRLLQQNLRLQDQVAHLMSSSGTLQRAVEEVVSQPLSPIGNELLTAQGLATQRLDSIGDQLR